MKTYRVLLSAAILVLISTMAFAQGPLKPPIGAFGTNGAPKAIMKTLNQVEPRWPIAKLPLNITNSGSYFLTASLSGDAGILVSCSDVEIDLNGYSLIGDGNGGVGITVAADVRRVTIRDGVIKAWGGGGISAGGGYDGRVLNVATHTNGLASGADDIFVGKEWVVQGCMSHQAGKNGIYAYALSAVRDCMVFSSKEYGIKAGQQCRIVDCTVYGCDVGGVSVMQDCIVKGLQVSENDVEGITAGDQNRIERNNLTRNTKGGEGVGINLTGSGNWVEGNTVSYSPYGIQAAGSNNLIIANSVMGAASRGYDISDQSRAGTILRLRDLPAQFDNSNPWANFEF